MSKIYSINDLGITEDIFDLIFNSEDDEDEENKENENIKNDIL